MASRPVPRVTTTFPVSEGDKGPSHQKTGVGAASTPATPSSFPWGTVLLVAGALGAFYYVSTQPGGYGEVAPKKMTGQKAFKEHLNYRGVKFTIEQDTNLKGDRYWLGCFGTIKGDDGECWPGDTRAAALNKTRQRIDARLDLENPVKTSTCRASSRSAENSIKPRQKRLAKNKRRYR